jgi:hypothetical protein
VNGARDRHWGMRCAIPTHENPVGSTTWVLCWQAAVAREFFGDPIMHARIRGRLIGAHERAGRVLVDYLLLPGEIHAVTQISVGDSAGSVARAFGNVVSRWVREAQPVRSPVLAGPYRAQPILSIDSLRNEARMLGWRPVFLGLCATPTHCPHGALRIALGLTPAKGFDARPLLRNFGEAVPEARASLRRWMSRRPSDQEWRAWELTRGLEMATGNVGPHPTMARAVDGSAAALVAAGGTFDVGGALELLEIWIAAKIQATSVLNLHEGSSATEARGRALVACLAVAHRLCSAASVARYFRRAKATLSEQMAACRTHPTYRHILDTPMHRILEESAALQAVIKSRGPK